MENKQCEAKKCETRGSAILNTKNKILLGNPIVIAM